MYSFLWQNDVVVSWRPSSEFPGNVWENSSSVFLSHLVLISVQLNGEICRQSIKEYFAVLQVYGISTRIALVSCAYKQEKVLMLSAPHSMIKKQIRALCSKIPLRNEIVTAVVSFLWVLQLTISSLLSATTWTHSGKTQEQTGGSCSLCIHQRTGLPLYYVQLWTG